MASLRVIQICALLAVSVTLAAAAVDYCKVPGLCGTSVHIACNSSSVWGEDCPEEPTPVMVVNTEELNQLIVRLHNVRRNRLALGNLSGYGSARRMATMRWSAELAQMARISVRRCQTKRDACRNTSTFKNSGQNIAVYNYAGEASSISDEQLITNSVASWWQEYNNANQQYMISYPAAYTGPPIDHFALMAQQKNTHVGCAMSHFVVDEVNKFLIICNYATNNIVGQHVYYQGIAANACQTGKNPDYQGLCKPTEVYPS